MLHVHSASFMAGQLLVGQGLLINPKLHDHIQTHSLRKTPLYEISGRSRELCLSKQNSHDRETFTPPAGIETQS